MRDTRWALRRPNAKSGKSGRRRKYSRLMTSWWMKFEAQISAPGKAFTFAVEYSSNTNYFNPKPVLALRSRGRGRKQADEEEGAELGDVAVETSSKASDVLQQSDDIRMADMDISDDGKRELFHV